MYIYIIECEDGSYYTGIAKDIVARLEEHFFRLKKSAKYTKSHQMVSLRCLWETDTKINACKLEYHIKQLTRQQKKRLIDSPHDIKVFFPDMFEPSTFTNASKPELEDIFRQVVSCNR